MMLHNILSTVEYFMKQNLNIKIRALYTTGHKRFLPLATLPCQKNLSGLTKLVSSNSAKHPKAFTCLSA